MRVATEDPVKNSANSAQLVGISVGGILFDPMTAEVYNNDRNSGWNYEALTIGAASNASLAGAIGYLGTDCNNAHVQPNGKYHYHGMPEELVSNLLAATGASLDEPDMVLVGHAADGYPMYARYGYSDPMNPASGVSAPHMSSSRSQSWRWVSVTEGRSMADCFNSWTRSSSTSSGSTPPPSGATAWS